MQIVIDIPEDIYDMCKKYHQKDYFGTEDHIIRTAIAHGVTIDQQPCEDEELDFVQPHKKIKVNLVPCEDAIRRQAAIDAMYHHFCDKSREECAQILHEVPSINPQASKEDIHREREQAYMRGYEDGSRKYRTEQSEDAISRAWLKTAIHNFYYGLKHTPTEEDIQAYIDAAPYVSTEKIGHWGKEGECPFCGYFKKWEDDNFCGHCGAKMVEPQESEDRE